MAISRSLVSFFRRGWARTRELVYFNAYMLKVWSFRALKGLAACLNNGIVKHLKTSTIYNSSLLTKLQLVLEGYVFTNCNKLYFPSTRPLIWLVYFKTLKQVWHYIFNKLLSIFDHALLKGPKTYIQYSWFLCKLPLCDTPVDSAGLLLSWSRWNMGTSSDERPFNWFDLIDE